MKLLRLAEARVLLWARERNGDTFEVSRVVTSPVQELCPTAPRCPHEVEGLGLFEAPSPWIDPGQRPSPLCPYSFALRGECLRHRNQMALELALLRPDEAARVQRLLEALGYGVQSEAVDPSCGRPRVLRAHAAGPATRDVRVVSAPGLGALVLVRDRDAVVRPGALGRLRVLPVGSNG